MTANEMRIFCLFLFLLGPGAAVPPAPLAAESPNPLLKMAAGAPKVRTLCSKWQLERPKYEPFGQNSSLAPWNPGTLEPWNFLALLHLAVYAPLAPVVDVCGNIELLDRGLSLQF